MTNLPFGKYISHGIQSWVLEIMSFGKVHFLKVAYIFFAEHDFFLVYATAQVVTETGDRVAMARISRSRTGMALYGHKTDATGTAMGGDIAV